MEGVGVRGAGGGWGEGRGGAPGWGSKGGSDKGVRGSANGTGLPSQHVMAVLQGVHT